MKALFSFLFSLCSLGAFAQIHRTELSSPLNFNDRSLDIVCDECLGQQLVVSHIEGTVASSTDDFINIQHFRGSALSASLSFPEISERNHYSIYEDASAKIVYDQSTGNCDGYIIVFTAKTNQAFLPGSSYFFETHAMRLDASLNVTWHKILFNNAGYSTYAVDVEVAPTGTEAIVLMRKNGTRTIVSKIDLNTGVPSTTRELDIIVGGVSLSSQPADIITTPRWPAPQTPQYAITGTAGSRVFLTLITDNLTPAKRMVYDIDGDAINDENGVSAAILDDDIILAGNYIDNPAPNLRSYGYVMRVQGAGSPNDRGNIIWSKQFSAPNHGTKIQDMTSADDGSGLLLAGQGNILEALSMSDDEGSSFLAKIDPTGNLIWSRGYEDSAFEQAALTDIDGSASDICLCGDVWPSSGQLEYDVLIANTDAAGIVNTVCDSISASSLVPLSSLRTLAGIGTTNLTAQTQDVIVMYDGFVWDSILCSSSNPAILSGSKWIDTDCDGVLNNGEQKVPGWTIELRDASGNILQTTVTDASGDYTFEVYLSGYYYITEQNQSGFDQGTPLNGAPHYLFTSLDTTIIHLDFGNCPCTDIIGYNPIPEWYGPSGPTGFYVYDIVEFDGYLLASSTNEIALWNETTETWNIQYTHVADFGDIEVFDNKLFISGTVPAYFDASIYGAAPIVNLLPGLDLDVYDYEVANGHIYAAGENGLGSNIWRSSTGTPNFSATLFSNSHAIWEIGAYSTELVAIGPFGTNFGTSENITIFQNPTASTGAATLRSLGLDGLTSVIPPQFENDYDIVTLGNEIHITGRFSSVGTVPSSRAYGIFLDGTASWRPNTGVLGGDPWDMDLYAGHIYIVGLFQDISSTGYDKGVVYDGTNYYPLDNDHFGNICYATQLAVSGKDKLVATTEELIQFAECGGSNCAISLPDTSLCPNEIHLFQAYISFSGGSFHWDFGDGSTSNSRVPSHSYIIPGTYTVTLDYDDGLGCNGTVMSTVQVIDRPDCNFLSDPEPWQKLYGDFQNNQPIKIKRTPFNEVLVLGNIHDTGPNGIKNGTLSKFDASTGALLWHYQILDPVEFRDIEYNLTTREYLITGLTLPFIAGGIWQDNQSVIIKVDDLGSSYNVNGNFNSYDHVGREYYEEITRHEYPATGANGHDFYFTGATNYIGSTPPPPSDKDRHVIGSMDINKNMSTGSWYQETDYVGDDEYQKGLFTIPSGEVITVGNSFPGGNNYGIVLEFDPVNGALIQGIQLDDIIDLYHGITYSSTLAPVGEMYIVVGDHFGSREAMIALIDNGNTQVVDAVRIPEIRQFEEVFKDAYDNYYAVGQSKNAADNGRNIVVKFRIDEDLALNTWTIDYIWSKYLEDGESQYQKAHIYVDERSDFIYYVDGREDNPSGFLLSDMLVMVTDLDMSTPNCVKDTIVNFNHFTIQTTTIAPLVTSIAPPSPFSQHVFNDLDYLCSDICVPPCVLDWTWTQDDCYGVQFTAIIDSTLTPPISYEWDIFNNASIDYTIANPYHDFIQSGSYDVCLTVYDAAGVLCGTVCKTIVVGPDTRLPQITCPPSISRQVPACDRGDTIFFAMPIATDCDDTLTVTCSHQSGDFFPCGVTTVTCSATDQEGNTVSCTFLVIVNCNCITMSAAALQCTDSADTYAFNIDVNDISGSNNNCSPPIINPIQAGVSMTINQMTQTANGWNVMGTLFTQACPMYNQLGLSAQMTCTCPDGLPVTCSSSIFMQTPCCDSIYLEQQVVCEDEIDVLFSAGYFGTVKDVSQSNWYVMAADSCPDTLWNSIPFQSDLDSQDLKISPSLIGDKLCYQLELILGQDEGPCDLLRSEVSCIDVCENFTCSLTADQSYCYIDTPIVPALIEILNPLPDCDYTIEWYLVKNGIRYILPNTDSLSYQPPPLTISNPNTCSTVTTYEVQFIGPCGPISCSSSITLYNDTTSIGEISIASGDSLPLCYGEDLVLSYSPNCLLASAVWIWEAYDSAGASWIPIPGAGTGNTVINTNPLYEDTWYRVVAQNGNCPPKETRLFVPVKDTMSIGPLQASLLDSCCSGGVRIQIDIPSCDSTGLICDCNYEIKLTKNGQRVHTATVTNAPVSFDYMDSTLLGDYSGNYQMVLTDLCCHDSLSSNVVSLKPPTRLILAGPCYACDTLSSLTITSQIINPPAASVSYQWYQIIAGTDVILSGETSSSLSTNRGGVYKLIATFSNSCVLEAIHQLTDCSTNSVALVALAIQSGNLRFSSFNTGLQAMTPSGTMRGITVNQSGALISVPCWPNDPQTALESLDAIVESPNHGVVFDYIDEAGEAQMSILQVDENGQLILTPGPGGPSMQDMTIDDGILEFQALNRGLILTSGDGRHWRIIIKEDLSISTELIDTDELD